MMMHLPIHEVIPPPLKTPPCHEMTPPSHKMTPPSHKMTPPSHEMTPPFHEMTTLSHEMTTSSHEMTTSSPSPNVSLLEGGGSVVYSTEPFSQSQIIEHLRNPISCKISNLPPVKPKAGDVYIVECGTYQDWSCDQYQWVHAGKNTTKKGSDVLIKNYYNIKLPGTKQGKGRARPNYSNKFKRSAFYIESIPNRILILYEGDEKLYVPLSHGNSKESTREYIRTCKSVLNEIKESTAKPMTTYRKLVCKEGIEGSHQGVLNPRNLRQVKNLQSKARTQKTLGKDDIYNIIQLAYHVDGFVGEITVYPDLLTIFALPELIHTFQELLNTKTSSPVCLVYDTTFNLGDFYVSPLVFRHVMFQESPWIPLAFLIHERKKQKCHNRLFEFISEKVPILKSKVIPFITDREPALTKSVQMYFPNIHVFHCWNHIRRDFKEELRKLGADSSEMNLYLSQWKQMSQCESEEDFLEMYEEVTSKWSENVKKYFDKNLKSEILTYSGRWLIEKFPSLYDPYSGITNNPSEGINSVLKRMTGWQELPVDVMMLSLYHLQNFYFAEIQRGRADIGNYHLKSKYGQAKLERDELELPSKLVEPEKIIEYVKSVITDISTSSKVKHKNPNTDIIRGEQTEEHTSGQFSPTPSPSNGSPVSLSPSPAKTLSPSPMKTPVHDRNLCQKSLARFVIDNKGVTHVPECEAFVVKGNNNKKYCVSLNPESCQCPSSTTCYHIIAVKMFIGLPIEDIKTEISLRSLSKRSLKKSDKKSGRKRPRANDLDTVVVPVLDSFFSGTITPSLEIQLEALYGTNSASLPIRVPAIQQQKNSTDCGVYAIANVVEFCYGYYTGKENIRFNDMYLRDHLVYCLDRQVFTPFPKIATKDKDRKNKKKPTIVSVPCDCRCRKPNCMQEMVGCDGDKGKCSVWRHRTCANASADEDWFCSPHRA